MRDGGLVRTLLRSARLHALAFTAFVAVGWLNQGVSEPEWDALRERADGSPAEHLLDRIRLPFQFLYRRASDEELYFATASATLGLPYDAGVAANRGDSPLPPLATPVDGRFHAPYAEVPFEYPPPNCAFVVLPRLVASQFTAYARVFGVAMAVLLLLAATIAAKLGAGEVHDERDGEAPRIVAFGLLLLAHGAIAVQRLDALVALLAILMVRAAVRGQDRSLGFLAGMIAATKFVPVLILPAVMMAGGVGSARRWSVVALFAALGAALGLGPMILLGRESLPLLLAYHSARGLHVESSLGVIYGAVKTICSMHEAGTLDYGSYNFHGAASRVLAQASAALTLGLIAVVLRAARMGSRADEATLMSNDSGPARDRRTTRIVLAGLASLTALWLGGKVFSPQYLTWALPLVVAVPGRGWRGPSLALGLILVLSQLYLRGFYDHVYNQWPAGIVTMVLRLVLLAGFFVALVRTLGRPAITALGATTPEQRRTR